MAAQELRRHKSTAIDQRPPELIKVRGIKFRCEIRKNKKESPEQWKESVIIDYPCIRRVIKQIVIISETNEFYQLDTIFYPTSCCHG